MNLGLALYRLYSGRVCVCQGVKRFVQTDRDKSKSAKKEVGCLLGWLVDRYKTIGIGTDSGVFFLPRGCNLSGAHARYERYYLKARIAIGIGSESVAGPGGFRPGSGSESVLSMSCLLSTVWEFRNYRQIPVTNIKVMRPDGRTEISSPPTLKGAACSGTCVVAQYECRCSSTRTSPTQPPRLRKACLGCPSGCQPAGLPSHV